MTGSQGRWQGLHVFYHGGHDELLCHAIGPVVASRRAAGAVHQAFFLRYWHGGPHVRLRLLVGEHDRLTVPAVAAELTDYLAAHPSPVKVDERELLAAQRRLAELEHADVEPTIVPGGTVVPTPYEPEFTKYGGVPGVAVAEALFECSCEVVLQLLPEILRRPGRRLGAGLSAMLTALNAAKLSGPELTGFLAWYCRFWTRYVPAGFDATWPGSLARQRASLDTVAETALSGPPGCGPLRRWHRGVSAAWTAITGGLEPILPAVTMAGPDSSDEQRRWFLLLNYLHTHNNRLGVLPAQEAFLAYLGHHVVCGLLDLPPQPELRDPTPAGQSLPRAL